MKLKSSLLTAAALSALAASAHAQMASDAPLIIPGTMPGTTPGFVRPPADVLVIPVPTTAMPANAPMPGAMPRDMPQMPSAMPADRMMNGDMMMMAAQDQLFCVRAGEGNLAEITFAKLALDKSRDANVRKTAQIILAGHTKAQNDLMQLMRAKGMMMMPMLSAPHTVVYDALKKASGDDFDKMYMAGQTVDHENAIALFSGEINAGMDDAFKAYANQYLPDIVGHTILIYNVAKQVKAPGADLRPQLPPVPSGIMPALMGKPIDMTNYGTVVASINAITTGMDMNAYRMGTM